MGKQQAEDSRLSLVRVAFWAGHILHPEVDKYENQRRGREEKSIKAFHLAVLIPLLRVFIALCE